ncbi:hypothetical protein LTR53_017787, partial [Teratosphaeriaceae sp. CCFEE 6253]
MQLPTRADFLANGLAPATVVPADGSVICRYCFGIPHDPVQLPCGHCFDRNCLSTLLMLPLNNFCPAPGCGRVLFAIDTPDLAARQLALYRRVGQATANAGLMFDEPGYPAAYHQVGLRSSDADLGMGVRSAQQYLFKHKDSRDTSYDSSALIDSAHLAPRICAMGNLIPALSALSGRPYSQREEDIWWGLVRFLPGIVAAQQGVQTDARELPRRLRATMHALALQERLASLDELVPFFDWSSESVLGERMAMLTNYIARCCAKRYWQWEDQQTEMQRVARAATAPVQRVREQRKRENKRCVV